jgi:hypothetical protein
MMRYPLEYIEFSLIKQRHAIKAIRVQITRDRVVGILQRPRLWIDWF